MRPSSTRAGFTLIEILIVVAIIGLLAAIAIPKFTETKSRAYITVQRSDLSNLMLQQELFYNNAQAYAPTAAQAGITPSAGVTLSVLEANGTGWSASTMHAGTAVRCAVYYGLAATVAPASQPGVIDCN
ncbi:MAG: prepilin-type N-terminal cleavage/methylation domain-containing protein [Gemmatimonadaceae bacterium]